MMPDDVEDEIKYFRPEDVPRDLTPTERNIIAARNMRRWADFLLEEGPAPEKGDKLVDVVAEGTG